MAPVVEHDIALGDVFALGDHVLACGDLERGDGNRLMERIGAPGVRLLYCDPPWNSRIHSVFRTWAHQAGVRKRDADLDRLFSRLGGLCRRADAFVLEVGNERRDDLLRVARKLSGYKVGGADITYSQGEAAAVFGVRDERNDRMEELTSAVRGGDSRTLPAETIRLFTGAGDWVCDPCLGLGLTLRAAHAAGRRCLGMELNPDRLARAMASARAGQPTRIGRLDEDET